MRPTAKEAAAAIESEREHGMSELAWRSARETLQAIHALALDAELAMADIVCALAPRRPNVHYAGGGTLPLMP